LATAFATASTRAFRETADMALLEVDNLSVSLPTARGFAEIVRGVSLRLDKGQTLGLVGESGSGKTLTALAIINLLPERARLAGRISFNGADMTARPDEDWCRIRGYRIGMVFQESMSALNPLQTIGRQVAEPLRIHTGLDRNAARSEARRLLDRVGIAHAAQRLSAYPHELSGGQRQRVTIAMALACRPDVLIADEPTSALDVTIQRQILDLIATLVEQDQMALMLISHDLGVIAETVAQTLVMYAGTIVEEAPTEDLLRDRAHPYSQALFAARPVPGKGRQYRLPTLPADGSRADYRSSECPFADRCRFEIPKCRSAVPPPMLVAPAHRARCIRLDIVRTASDSASA
jgi:peptide/nickel transport system ATP-binding protein